MALTLEKTVRDKALARKIKNPHLRDSVLRKITNKQKELIAADKESSRKKAMESASVKDAVKRVPALTGQATISTGAGLTSYAMSLGDITDRAFSGVTSGVHSFFGGDKVAESIRNRSKAKSKFSSEFVDKIRDTRTTSVPGSSTAISGGLLTGDTVPYLVGPESKAKGVSFLKTLFSPQNIVKQTGFDLGVAGIQSNYKPLDFKWESGASIAGQALNAASATGKFGFIGKTLGGMLKQSDSAGVKTSTETAGIKPLDQKFRTSAKTQNIISSAERVAEATKDIRPAPVRFASDLPDEKVVSMIGRLKSLKKADPKNVKLQKTADEALVVLNNRKKTLAKAERSIIKKEKFAKNIEAKQIKVAQEEIEKIAPEITTLRRRMETHGLEPDELGRYNELEERLVLAQQKVGKASVSPSPLVDKKVSGLTQRRLLGDTTTTGRVMPKSTPARPNTPFNQRSLSPSQRTVQGGVVSDNSTTAGSSVIGNALTDPLKEGGKFSSVELLRGIDEAPVGKNSSEVIRGRFEELYGGKQGVEEFDKAVLKKKEKLGRDLNQKELSDIGAKILREDNDRFIKDRNIGKAKRGAFNLKNNFITIGRRLSNFGGSSKRLSEDITQASNVGKTIESDFIYSTRDIMGSLSKAEKKSVANFLDTGEGFSSLNQAQKELAQKFREISDLVADELSKRGVSFGKIENYLPRILKQEFMDQIGDEAVLSKMLRNRGVDNPADMAADLRRIFDPLNNQKFFEKQRLARDLPEDVLETDLDNVIEAYFKAASTRMAQTAKFGANNERLYSLVRKSLAEQSDNPANQNFILDSLGPILGQNQRHNLSRQITSAQVIAKMGMSAITNLGEVVPTAMRNGAARTFVSALEAMTPAGRKKAASLGSEISDLMRAQQQQTGSQKWARLFLKTVGFEAVEKWAARTNVLSAEKYGGRLLKNLQKNPNNLLARNILQDMLPNSNIDEIVGRGFSSAEKTSLAIKSLQDLRPLDPKDVPLYFHGDLGAVINQFKSFSVKFSDALWEQTASKIVNGRTPTERALGMKNFATLLIVGSLVGEPIRESKDAIKSFLSGEDRMREKPDSFEDWTKRMGENMLQVGGIGFVTDMLMSFEYAKWSGAGAFLGPTFSDADNIAKAGIDIREALGEAISRGGDPIDELQQALRDLTGIVPIIDKARQGVENRSESSSPIKGADRYQVKY